MKIQFPKQSKIGVLSGGWSQEREISLRSGKNVLAALLRLGYPAVLIDPAQEDIPKDLAAVYLVLHGSGGEDGVIQGVLEMYKIPYTGSGVTASAISMDKRLSKIMFEAGKIPTAPWYLLESVEQVPPWGWPVIVKPLREGSSFGISIIDTNNEWQSDIPSLLTKYGQLMCEKYISGREITVGVLEQDQELMILPILELRPKKRFYDFEAKYTSGMTDFILPAELTDEVDKRCRETAKQVFRTLGCRGVSRVDMIVGSDDVPYVLELNSSPGMTDQSDLPAQARAAGIEFDKLVEMILQSAKLDNDHFNRTWFYGK